MSLVRILFCLTLSVSLLATHSPAAPPTTKPAVGLRHNTPQDTAITGVRIVVAPGRVIDTGTVVIRDGIIEAVGRDVEIPDDVRVIRPQDAVIYPGLIDAFSDVSTDRDTYRRAAPYWNDDVRPQAQVAHFYKPDSSVHEKLRMQGVVARLVAPRGGIIKGQSAIVSTGEGGNERVILKANVAQHLRLTVSSGRSRDEYPNSPMGAVALARQAMYDAQWYRRAWNAFRSNRTIPRPERNDALASLQTATEHDQMVIADTSNELFVLRADRFAREFALNLVVRGSGYEYRRLEAIHATGRPVIVPVDFPKAPNVGSTEAALDVRLERLMHWDLAPENPGRLEQAGVRILLTSDGLSDVGEFLKAVRKAVRRGLSAEGALRALTTTPAQLFEINEQLGTVESGKAASFIITDGDLFADETKLLETWVDGQRYEMDKPPVFAPQGTWQLNWQEAAAELPAFRIQVTGEPNKLAGEILNPAAETGG